jgi:hypothetical protein
LSGIFFGNQEIIEKESGILGNNFEKIMDVVSEKVIAGPISRLDCPPENLARF